MTLPREQLFITDMACKQEMTHFTDILHTVAKNVTVSEYGVLWNMIIGKSLDDTHRYTDITLTYSIYKMYYACPCV